MPPVGTNQIICFATFEVALQAQELPQSRCLTQPKAMYSSASCRAGSPGSVPKRLPMEHSEAHKTSQHAGRSAYEV